MQKPGDERGDQAVRSSPAPGEGECSGGNDTGPLEGGVLGPPAHRTCNNILYMSSDVSIFCNVFYIKLYLEFVISYKIQAIWFQTEFLTALPMYTPS